MSLRSGRRLDQIAGAIHDVLSAQVGRSGIGGGEVGIEQVGRFEPQSAPGPEPFHGVHGCR